MNVDFKQNVLCDITAKQELRYLKYENALFCFNNIVFNVFVAKTSNVVIKRTKNII